MPESSNVKIRVKSGESEAEVEGPLTTIREAIDLIPEVLAKLPKASTEMRQAPAASLTEVEAARSVESKPVPGSASPSPASLPTVTIEKGDSLSDVISRFFSDSWGRSPRKLMEVREALQSYGLNYPKQSVAVALLRLAKSSKIRRFKGDGGEYVYTASTAAARIPAPMGAVAPAPAEEQPPPAEVEVPEEQLDLDAPATN